MEEKKKVPEIRFQGFTDDWEQRKFSDIAARESSISTSTTDVPSVEYEDVTAEEGRLNKDIHLKEAVKSGITFDSSQVLYGKLRPYLHNWLNPDFKGIAVGDWWVLKPINMDKKFLYRLIQTQQFDNIANQSSGSKMPRADWNLISNSEFMVPFSKEEQSKIGRYFDNIDHLITLHQRKHEKLVNVKKSMLERLFVQEGFLEPQIRFGDFKAPWQRAKLGEIVTPYADPVETPHDGYERLGIRSHGKGVFHDYVEAGKELDTAQMHRVAAHNLIVNITFAWEHAVAITVDDDEGKLVSHRFPQFAMTERIYDQFLKYLILDARFRHHLLLSSPGGAGRNRVLKVPEMLEYEMMLPDIEEQKQIAGFLNALDELIELYQIELEKLKNIKKATLQKMFV